jgi:DNA-binding FadR family transcriptional regulator
MAGTAAGQSPGPAAAAGPGLARRLDIRRAAIDWVVAMLRVELASGRIARGDPLPSQRALRAEYAVPAGVIRDALAMLAAQGLITIPDRGGRPVARAGPPPGLAVRRHTRTRIVERERPPPACRPGRRRAP